MRQVAVWFIGVVRSRANMQTGQQGALRQVLNALREDNLVIFAGAGVSRDAGLPSWPELVTQLRERATSTGNDERRLLEIDRLITLQQYVEAMSALQRFLGDDAFHRVVERRLDDSQLEPTRLAKAIAALRPRAVATTNLDRLLERAFQGDYEAVMPPLPGDLAQRRHYIAKLHGTVSRRDSWVLTQQQYDRQGVDLRCQEFIRALYRARTILFVGYGLDDKDFNSLLSNIRGLSQGQPPHHYAVVPEAELPPSRRETLEQSGLELITYSNGDGSHTALPLLLDSLRPTGTDAPSSPARAPKGPQLVKSEPSRRPTTTEAKQTPHSKGKQATRHDAARHRKFAVPSWIWALGGVVLLAVAVKSLTTFFPSFERALESIEQAKDGETLVVVAASRSAPGEVTALLESLEDRLAGIGGFRYERAYAGCDLQKNVVAASERLSARALLCHPSSRLLQLFVVARPRQTMKARGIRPPHDGAPIQISPTSQVLLTPSSSLTTTSIACLLEQAASEVVLASGHDDSARLALDRVISCLETSHGTFQQRERPYFQRAFMLSFVSGDHRAARQDLASALRIRPNFPEAHNNMGLELVELGDVRSALDSFDTAIKQDPEFAEAFNNRGNAHRILGDVDAALADLNRAQALAPDQVAVLINKGLVYYAAQDYESAIGELTKAIAKKPDNLAWVYMNRARVYQTAGHVESALRDLSSALELEPNSSSVLVNRAILYRELGPNGRALDDLDRAIAYDADSIEARYDRAVVLKEMGDVQRAAAELQELQRRRPDHVLSLALEAAIVLESSKVKTADCQRVKDQLALRDHSSGPIQEERQGRANIAFLVVLHCGGDVPEAINIVGEALRDDPRDLDILHWWAQLHLMPAKQPGPDAAKRRTIAVKAMEEAVQARSSPKLLEVQAELFDHLGRPGAKEVRERAETIQKRFKLVR